MQQGGFLMHAGELSRFLNEAIVNVKRRSHTDYYAH